MVLTWRTNWCTIALRTERHHGLHPSGHRGSFSRRTSPRRRKSSVSNGFDHRTQSLQRSSGQWTDLSWARIRWRSRLRSWWICGSTCHNRTLPEQPRRPAGRPDQVGFASVADVLVRDGVREVRWRAQVAQQPSLVSFRPCLFRSQTTAFPRAAVADRLSERRKCGQRFPGHRSWAR